MRGLAVQILAALGEAPGGLTDVELARLFDKHQAHIHTTCERLAAQNFVVRDKNVRPLRNYLARSAEGIQARLPRQDPIKNQLAAQDEWFWEGNVQAALVSHLAVTGWRILRTADTASREHGVDIIASRNDETLYVEVKGWPSRVYADPSRSGELKRTQPTVQANVWFDSAIVAALRLRQRHLEAKIAVCFPDFPRYRDLLTSVAGAMDRCDVMTWLVHESGLVSAWP